MSVYLPSEEIVPLLQQLR